MIEEYVLWIITTMLLYVCLYSYWSYKMKGKQKILKTRHRDEAFLWVTEDRQSCNNKHAFLYIYLPWELQLISYGIVYCVYTFLLLNSFAYMINTNIGVCVSCLVILLKLFWAEFMIKVCFDGGLPYFLQCLKIFDVWWFL